MELLRLTAIVALGLLLVSDLVLSVDGGAEVKSDDNNQADGCIKMDSILDLVKDMEEEMDNPVPLEEVKKQKEEPRADRKKRSFGYTNFGFPGYSPFPYIGGSRLLPWIGGYAGYAQSYSNYAYASTRIQSFIRSFTPGRYHIENNCGQSSIVRTQLYYQQPDYNCVVHDFYKRGTYTSAKTEFMALPFVRVVPVTTVKSVDYVGYINAGYGYTATLCGNCYQGYPQIEIRCNTRPYYHVVRRFTFVPESARQDVYYRSPQDFGITA